MFHKGSIKTAGDDETGTHETFVYEDSEDADEKISSFEEVLWAAIAHFGMGGSRYDAERLVIRREPGDKHNDGKEEK